MSDQITELTARVEALEAKVLSQSEDMGALCALFAESQLSSLAAWSALHGLLKAVGWNPYIEYMLNQSFEGSFEALRDMNPTQDEMDVYELKVAALRSSIAKSREIAEASAAGPAPE